MNEREIAEKRVTPYLEELGWPKQLITQYGKVPVQMGTEIKWADIVAMFVDENNSAVPYLVVEVKTALNNMNSILAQADSYSKLLDAQYFVATDGENYSFYQRRPAGGYIRINNVPIPDRVHLTVTQNTKFKTGYLLCARPSIEGMKQTGEYKELSSKIDDYFNLMAENKYYMGRTDQYSLRTDIISHYISIKWINSLIHYETDTLEPNKLKEDFDFSIMCYKPPNLKRIYSEIDGNFGKVKAFLRFIKELKGEPEENLDELFDTSSELHINGIGPFVISQFLAGAFPKDYTIIEDRMVNTMKNLNLIDTKVRADTPKGYLYINEICKKLYADIFSKKIEENKSKLGFKIDQDFSLIVVHEFFWEYDEFQSYDVARLEEATGERRQKEEKETEVNVALLEGFVEDSSCHE